MKKLIPSLVFTAVLGTGFIGSAAYADQETASSAAYGYDSYTCDALVDLEYEQIGSVVYYIRGHYDAKNDIWADYAPGKQTVIGEDFYVPVEDIYNYCLKNPENTIVEALTRYND